MLLAALAALAVGACGKIEEPTLDAQVDLVSSDSPPTPSDGPAPLAVDFAVENCPAFDAIAMTCTGKVPLTVRFVPLVTATVTKYLWDFGDGSASSSEAAPSHIYSNPRVYTVKLIATGVGGGVVTMAHAGFIVARPNNFGEPCESSAQCQPEISCLCPARAACSTGPARGMCASECILGLCNDGQVCAGLLTATPPPEAAEPWQTSLCLPGCATDADCAGGLRCRTLPPGPAGSAWVRGCFADAPRDVGDPCTDASGNHRDDLCASGLCADLGAQGLCTMNCQVASCPPGSDCALLGDGRKLCLRPCTGGFTCDRDALLTCVVPGPGALGYQRSGTDNTNAASSYCAPKPCVSDDVCLPTGSCIAETGGGHCVRR
jgi:PKD repeat protein